MTTKHSIDRIVADPDERIDHSLRGHSLQRALQQDVPKTLTPYEWQEWYELHGVPEAHAPKKPATRQRWWRYWPWFKLRDRN
ncbi:MAG: hypothetical protein ACI9JM_003389 [Halioglobus sp.]|jgi:hypothetical protein